MVKRNLPAIVRKEISGIEDLLLPSIYKVPTDTREIEKARRKYFTIDDAEDSYAELHNSYAE